MKSLFKIILKTIFIIILIPILLFDANFSTHAHDLDEWSQHYTKNRAYRNEFDSFAIGNWNHMGISTINYYIDSATLPLNSNNRQKVFNAWNSGIALWGTLINSIETSPSEAHMKIWYNSDIAFEEAAAYAPSYGGDPNKHYRKGLVWNSVYNDYRYDAEIFITFKGLKDDKNAIRKGIIAHELGHHYGIMDLKPLGDDKRTFTDLDTIYNDNYINHPSSYPTKVSGHDKNALRIGLNDLWYEVVDNDVRLYQESPGVWKYQEPSGAWRSLGDINNNGEIEAVDARAVLRYSASLERFNDTQKAVADVNRSSDITAADARQVLRYSAGIISKF